MRLTGLLGLLLFFLILFFAAPAASYAQTAKLPAAKTASADSKQPVDSCDQPQMKRVDRLSRSCQVDRQLILGQPLVSHDGDLVLRESPENDGLCYTMRTYRMAREDKTSDVTHLVRQAKCTSARMFGFKTAVERVDRPLDKPGNK